MIFEKDLAVFFSGILAIVGAAFASFFIYKLLGRRRIFSKLLELRLLSIELGKSAEAKEKQDILKEISRTSQLLSLLGNLKMPFAFEAAVHNVGEDIHFYLAVPESALAFASSQVHSLWPEAQVKPADEYTIFAPEGAAIGAFVKQKHNNILPIRTYVEAELDTFASILSNFANLELVGEGMSLQIIVKPAPVSIKEKIVKAIYRLKKGEKLAEVVKEPFLPSPEEFAQVAKLLNPTPSSAQKNNQAQGPVVVDEEAVKILNQKIAKPIFDVNIRLLAAATSQFQAENLLSNLIGSFEQFSAPLHNELKIVKPRNMRQFIFDYTMRAFSKSQSMVMGADEITSIFHLPSSGTDIPKIKWLRAKEAPPPTALAVDGVLIGETSFRGERRQIYINDDDRRRHIYILGQTGTGKTTLIANMAADDIKNGKGVSIIDPHGDLIESVLTLIPKERIEDVIVFDPAERLRPLGMNMLEYDFEKPEEKTFIANEMLNILGKLYDLKTTGGPMFELYLRNALLLLMEDMVNEPATLLEVPRLFTDSEYRARKLARCLNPMVIDFWEKQAVKATGEQSLANMTVYVTSKFTPFITNDYMRPIIGQVKSAFSFRKAMDEGKILLVNLSKGRIGDLNAGLLGMVITGKILMAALSRVDIPSQDDRRDFNLYIDEFQNFTTESIATILSEARKYRLNLTIAHQFIGQLTEEIRDAVFGNVGSSIVFRIGADDAEFVIKQFEPVFTKSDLINIDNRNAYVKILINGQTVPPFNVRVLPPKKGNTEAAAAIKDLSRLKYGADRRTIELDVVERLRK